MTSARSAPSKFAGPDPGVVPLEAEVDRIGPVLDGGEQARPIPRRRKEFGLGAGGRTGAGSAAGFDLDVELRWHRRSLDNELVHLPILGLSRPRA